MHTLRFALRALSSRPSRVASFLLAASCLALPATAQDHRFDPVAVVGSREPAALSRSSGDIVVVSSEAIRQSSADSLEDLLRREAGLQIVRNGGPGQNAGFFIRGASTNSTIVLVDGVRIGSATLGQAELEALDLAQIERIEVLRGPASSLYGADGVGGVVQIFTRRGEGPLRTSGALAGGGTHSFQGDLAASGSHDRFDFAAAIGRQSSRGVSAVRPGDVFGSFNPDRDGYARETAQLRLGVAPAPGHRLGASLLETRLRAQFDSAEFAPPSFAADPSPDFRNRLKTRVAAADYRGEVNDTWTTTLQFARSVDDLLSGASTPSRFTTRRTQATWQNGLRLGDDHRLLVAAERVDERVRADALGDRSRRNHALVVGGTLRAGGHSLQADLRRDDNSAYGANTTGRVGHAWKIDDAWKLRALAGTTFRAPTFNDLYFPGFGVATIRPERGRSVEAGVDWDSGASRVSATLYRNDVRDLIGYEPDVDANGASLGRCPPGYPFGCARNVGRARLQGASLSAAHRTGAFHLRATLELLDAIDRSTGQRLPRRAAHQETLAIDWNGGAWSLGAAALIVGSRPDGGVVLGGYGTLDLRATWRVAPGWRLEAKLLNALDHRIEPARDYQGPGRQAWLGVRHDSQGL